MNLYKLFYLNSLILASFYLGTNTFSFAESQLLEKVKNNPKEAIALCKKFKYLNSRGISSGSREVIKEISLERQLSATDAEILSIYVIGMYCPEIK